jgi:hypothetical protein
VHAPFENNSDDVKDSFSEKLGCVFDQFPRYDMKISLGDSNGKVGREDIFKPTVGIESSSEINYDKRLVNLTHLKTWFSQVQCSLVATFINTPGPLLRETHTTRLITSCYIGDGIQVYSMSNLSQGLIVILITVW